MNNIQNNKKVNNNELLYIAIATIPIGFTLTGIGVGKFFNEYWAGTLVGLGIGLIITAPILINTIKSSSFEENE